MSGRLENKPQFRRATARGLFCFRRLASDDHSQLGVSQLNGPPVVRDLYSGSFPQAGTKSGSPNCAVPKFAR